MKSKIVIYDDSVILYENYIHNNKWEHVHGYARNGLTYLIQNNAIKFYIAPDYFYKNIIASMELPLYIIDEAMGIDGDYDDIDELTEILDRIFLQYNEEGIDLSLYLKKLEAEETYQPLGDYLTKASGDTIYQPIGDYLTKASGDTIYQPIGNYQPAGDYALKSDIPSLDGYATETWVKNQGYVNQLKTINNISLIWLEKAIYRLVVAEQSMPIPRQRVMKGSNQKVIMYQIQHLFSILQTLPNRLHHCKRHLNRVVQDRLVKHYIDG